MKARQPRDNLTPQRRAVLAVIQESDEHLTAREIYQRASARQPGLSYATVYNTLSYLKQSGLVHEIALGSDASRYDRRELSHGHAICEECGRVCDLDLPDLDLKEGWQEALRRSGFAARVVTVTLYGRCQECQKHNAPTAEDAA